MEGVDLSVGTFAKEITSRRGHFLDQTSIARVPGRREERVRGGGIEGAAASGGVTQLSVGTPRQDVPAQQRQRNT